MRKKLISLSRFNKQLILVLFDSIALLSVILASYSIRLGYFFFPSGDLFWVVLFAPIIAIPVFIHFRLYRAIVRFIGFKALWSIFQAVTLYALLWSMISFMVSVDGMPRSVILMNWLLGILIISGSRLFGRWLLSEVRHNKTINVIIYGAGAAGRQLSIALTMSSEYQPVAFIDDDADLQNQSINGIEVFSKDNLDFLIENKGATEVLIAMPSSSYSQRNKVINFLGSYNIFVRSLPGVTELAQGKIKIADLREISIKDLLGRDPVAANVELLSLNITNKVVMVTGAGGSIGSELCRQILFLKPQLLILFERNEFSLYSIDMELSNMTFLSSKILPILGSVNNRNRLSQIIKRFDVHTIYHAAAYKHVPMVEYNNAEGVSNNIFGTLNCVEVAIENRVETFVLISTDKAVRPTNTMGATKRFAEMILQALTLTQSLKKQNSQQALENFSAGEYGTCFSIVRFGNVLDKWFSNTTF